MRSRFLEIFDEQLVTIGLEHATVTVTNPREVGTYLRLFDVMREAALVDQAALDLLSNLRSGYSA